MLYSEFAPTGFDRHINIDDDDGDSREDWIVAPVGIDRDTACAITLSNWQCCIDDLESSDIEYEIHRFGHWANGWFEILLIKPTERGAAWIYDTERAIADYPILDEMKLSELEHDHESEAFDNWAESELNGAIESALDIELSDYLTIDFLGILSERACVYWEHARDGASIDVDRCADVATIDDLETAGIEFQYLKPQGTVFELIGDDGYLIAWSEDSDQLRDRQLSNSAIVETEYREEYHDCHPMVERNIAPSMDWHYAS
jgi:hypothetical protein